jgi:alanine racemase
MQKTLSVINLSAISGNVATIQKLSCGRPIFAVVKADAYGHGAVQVAHAIQRQVQCFCVAICDEGAALRAGGITKPILVFTPPSNHEDVARMKYYGLMPTVNSLFTARLCKAMPCHIKLNTGMNRYGCDIKQLPVVLQTLRSEDIMGVYSHLYCPDDREVSQEQLSLFSEGEKLVKAVAPHAVAHLAASGGILAGERFLKDAVRPGLLLYGYAPNGKKLAGITPALTVYAHRIQQTECVGKGAGYGQRKGGITNLSTYRLGYADGFFRTTPLGEGMLCMDGFVGTQDKKKLTVLSDANEYAVRAHTSVYEVLCKATMRSERVFKA